MKFFQKFLAPDDGAPAGDAGQDAPPEQAPPPSADEPKVDKAYLDNLVTVMKEQQQAEVARLLEEERQKAGMDDAQKAQFELDKRTQAVEQREQEAARRELQADTLKFLGEKSLPVELADYIIGTDTKDTLKRIDAFKPLFDQAVQAQVEARMTGKTPARGNPAASSSEDMRAKVRSAIGG